MNISVYGIIVKNMTKEEYNKFCETLQNKGYKKYPSSTRFEDGEYAWYKSYGESKYEEDRSNYQMCFEVYDFSKYIHNDPHIKRNPICIEPLVLVSRIIEERVDLHLNHIGLEDSEIDEYEKHAENFYKWVEQNIKLKVK